MTESTAGVLPPCKILPPAEGRVVGSVTDFCLDNFVERDRILKISAAMMKDAVK